MAKLTGTYPVKYTRPLEKKRIYFRTVGEGAIMDGKAWYYKTQNFKCEMWAIPLVISLLANSGKNN